MSKSEENKYYISSLFDFIDDAFRSGNNEIAEKIQSFIAQGKIKGREFNDEIFPMKGPTSNIDTGFIILQAGFLSYLWTVCYFMIGLIEIYQDKAGIDQPVVSLIDSEKFELLNHTFAWGKSLKPSIDAEFVPWPDHIANPMQKEIRVKQANQLLVLSASYLMYHELGHLVLHADAAEFIKTVKSPFYTLREGDSRRLRNMEIQADVFALDCMFGFPTEEHNRYMKFFAAIVTQLAEFFLRGMPDTRSKNYPDLDERLKRVLDRIDISDPGLKMNIDLVCSIGLQLFLTLTFAEFIPPDPDKFSFEDFDELKAYLFKIIDAWKEKYNA